MGETVNKVLQVVPGRAAGGSFKREKNYIAKKEFAYRMCARRPTSAMPKPFLCCVMCLCCVMSRDAMRCHVMCAHVMSCHLLCPAMGWNVMSLRCHWL